jgi:hypothetical protein
VDEAFRWLDRAVEVEPNMGQAFRDPLFRPLHGDPRWEAFRERTGSSERQLAAIEFDVTPALRAGK